MRVSLLSAQQDQGLYASKLGTVQPPGPPAGRANVLPCLRGPRAQAAFVDFFFFNDVTTESSAGCGHGGG